MKIAVVTCYKHNDYVRARALRTAVAACPGVETVVIRNRHKGLLRYPEVALRLAWLRIFGHPDAYVITFRGYEIMLLLRLTFVRKPIIFDEFVNFTEWMEEHGRLGAGSVPHHVFRRWNRWVVKRCRFLLADTDAHAKNSSILNMLSVEQYRVVPVCADETIFHPEPSARPARKQFTVFYYGNMLPLHGLDYVLQAATLLKDNSDIQFHLVGGKGPAAQACADAAAAGARITYQSWVPFSELPKLMREASVVLAGPFGGTAQAQFVVTGKAYQALAVAAPVIIGRNQASRDFRDRQDCLLVPQADAQALAEAIGWAADHPKELAAIGRAGHKLYETHFSQTTVNKIIRETIEAL